MSENKKRFNRYFLLFLVAVTAIHLALLLTTPLNLAPDESHYWDWSRRLDWSYYSKGPAVAGLIYVSRAIFGDTEFGVRAPAFICQLALTGLLYLSMRSLCGAAIALMIVIAWRTTLLFTAQGLVMTTDAPLALVWCLAIWFAVRAVKESSTKSWIGFGLMCGLAVWCKYTALILPISVGSFLILSSRYRKHLVSKGAFIGYALLIAAALPILRWNAVHDWVNLAHNASHLSSGSGFRVRPEKLLELVGGQIGLVGPVLLVLLVIGICRGYAMWRKGDEVSGLLLFTAVPLLILCLVVSLTKSVYANWPMPAYLGLFFLVGHLLANSEFDLFTRWYRRAVSINLLFVFFGWSVFAGYTWQLPLDRLPTKKLLGWGDLATIVNDYQTKVGEQFPIATENYDVASALAFYVPNQPHVFNLLVDGRRMNQYDIWSGWERLKGKNVLLVLKDRQSAERINMHFEKLESIGPGEGYPISYEGTELRRFFLFLGRNYDGYQPPWPDKR